MTLSHFQFPIEYVAITARSFPAEYRHVVSVCPRSSEIYPRGIVYSLSVSEGRLYVFAFAWVTLLRLIVPSLLRPLLTPGHFANGGEMFGRGGEMGLWGSGYINLEMRGSISSILSGSLTLSNPPDIRT